MSHIRKEIQHALVKCQNDIASYMMLGSGLDEKKRVKGDMERNVGLLLNLIPGIQERDKGLHKEMHRLHNTYRMFKEEETDENLAAFQNELARIQEFLI